MEKKFKADNGAGNIFWGFAAVILLALYIYRYKQGEEVWYSIFYFVFILLFMLSTTIREYVITDLNFLEIRYVLKIFSKNRRFAIGDMVAMKKIKKNRLRIDKVRGFEVLSVRESDIDALIAELKERNPRIIVAGENDDQPKP
ncbi:MAG: hypothetical protein GX042_03820 [Bacteroidales bacterium]|jgi:hypothetical protein|nr:hypothetical protein [Bacteroidales bacterium]